MAQPVECPDPKHRVPTEGGGKKRRIPRSRRCPFVAICAKGHLDDFPFREWVHRSHNPTCRGPLRLESRGGGGLDGQVVVCDSETTPKGCGAQRSLDAHHGGALGQPGRAHPPDGQLGRTRTSLLLHRRPPLARGVEGRCGEPIRGALRAAGNVYFPKVESSIYLPRQVGAVSAELHDLLSRQTCVRCCGCSTASMAPTSPRAADPRLRYRQSCSSRSPTTSSWRATATCSASEVETRAQQEEGRRSEATADDNADDLTGNDEWRYPEFRLLRETPTDDYLTASDPGVHPNLSAATSIACAGSKSCEKRGPCADSPASATTTFKLSVGKAMLRRRQPPPEHDWLPAYVVKGEGIYLELNRKRLEPGSSGPTFRLEPR